MNKDLISRSALRQVLASRAEKLRASGECGGCEAELLQAVIKMVDAQPQVDAAITQRGRWKNGCDCSVCGRAYGPHNDAFAQHYHYCTFCGAKMDGGKNNGTAK